MGQPMKKGKAGNAVNYLTRAQALRKLQVSLADFRRLCILKGIYPRDPKRKLKGHDKTYYHVKDIKYLMHEPLLAKFREMKAFMSKVRKAVKKGQKHTAKRLDAAKPTYTLDHLLKERYPTFVSALGDLDDALCTLEIFAALPALDNKNISSTIIRESAELVEKFRSLCVRQRALKKSFVSIKGYYYQVEFLGQHITWLAPHKFAQHLPAEVDFRVLRTFLDFYRTLLKFVNFKLENLLDQGYVAAPKPTDGVFNKRTVYISREVPRHALEFVLSAGGAKVVYANDASNTSEDDASITHQIVDRPVNMLTETMSKGNGRDFVQPQWAFDSLNAHKMLPCVLYAPGRACPPHLSPFIDDNREGYVPMDRRKTAEDSTEAPHGDALNDSEMSFDDVEEAERRELGVSKPRVQPSDAAEAVNKETSSSKETEGGKKRSVAQKKVVEEDNEDEDDDDESIDGEFDGVEGSDDEEDSEDDDAIEDSEAEEEEEEDEDSEDKAASQKLSVAEKKKQEELARRKALLSSNQRKLYDIMKATNSNQNERNKKLEDKRVALEKKAKATSAGASPAKKAKKM